MRWTAPVMVLALGSIALAQGPGGPPGGGPPPMPEKFKPIFQLIGTVMNLDNLTQTGKLKLDSAEKKSLRALLVSLVAKKAMPPAEASKASQAINRALSAAHQKQLASSVGRMGGPGGMPPPPGDGPPPGSPPGGGGPGGPPLGGLFEALQNGKPFNPLGPSDPIAGRVVKNLIARLGK